MIKLTITKVGTTLILNGDNVICWNIRSHLSLLKNKLLITKQIK